MEDSDRIKERNNHYQKSVNSEALRRRRHETAINLRKQKRVEHISKKRAIPFNEGQKPKQADNSSFLLHFPLEHISAPLEQPFPLLFDLQISPEGRFDYLLSLLTKTNDQAILFYLLETLRKVLSSEKIPHLNEIMESEVLDFLIYIMQSETDSLMKKECMWCFVNIASGPSEYGEILIARNMVQIIADQILSSPNEVKDLMIWFLGNIAGNSVESRDAILKSGAFQSILKYLYESTDLNPKQISNCIWVVSNLVRGNPHPPREIIKEAVKLIPLYIGHEDCEVVYDTLWIANYVSGGDIDGIQDVIETNQIERLIDLAVNVNGKLQVPALRTLGNIITGDDVQTECVLNFGIIGHFSQLLYSQNRAIKKEALWGLSNILAGSPEQVGAVFNSDALQLIVQALADEDTEIKREAVWAVANATRTNLGCRWAMKLVENEAFEPLVGVLWHEDAEMLLVALKAIENIMRASNEFPGYEKINGISQLLYKFEQIGGLGRLEELEGHSNPRVYEKVIEIMNEFYGIEEVQDENVQVNPSRFII